MATRVMTSAQLVRQRASSAREAWRGVDPRTVGRDTARGIVRTLFPAHLSAREWLWRALWLPWWLGSDMPAPTLPERQRPLPAAGAAGDHIARHLRRLVRRLWIQRALLLIVRSVWLGVAVGCAWVGVELLGGPEMNVRVLVAVTLVLCALGLALAACIRPTPMQVARMLDRSFSLQDRMRTAVEHLGRDVPKEGDRASVVYLQMADAANVMTAVHAYPAFRPGVPVREVVLGIAAGLLLGALYLIRGAGGDLPPVTSAAVPGFVPAKERLAAPEPPVTRTEPSSTDTPSTAEIQERAEQSNAAREDLEALADALDDHPTTRAAAEAIREGDYERASQELSEAAAEADQLSPAEREGLASDLDAAAGAMTGENPDLQDAATEAADGLREGGEPAKEGVEDLADQVAETGDEVVSQDQLAGEMREAQAAEQRAAESGEQSGEGSDQPADSSESAPGDGESSESSGQSGEAGAAGEGNDAAPGEGEQGAEGEATDAGGPSDEGEGASDDLRQGDPQGGEASDRSGGQTGESEQPGTGEGETGGASDAPAAEGEGGERPGEQGSEQGDTAQTGSGSGSGEGEEQSGAPDPGGQTGQQQEDVDGDGIPDTNLTEPPGGYGDVSSTPGEPEDPRDGLTLSRSPDAEGVQTSGDAGSSSLGSGSGATAGTGATSQGEVGEAGPDANRVPDDYRDIVEDYFTEGD